MPVVCLISLASVLTLLTLSELSLGRVPDPGRLPDPSMHLPEIADWRIEMESALGVQTTDPLITAIIANDTEKLRSLLATGRSGAGVLSTDGATLVGLACIYHHPECLSLLLAHGGDPNKAGGPGSLTPLLDATTSKCHDCISILLESGADPNGLGGVQGNHMRMSPLANAAAANDVAAIELLVKDGAAINGPTGTTSPLIMAAVRCNIEAVHALLAHDANPNTPTPNGSMTPLTSSARAACPSIMNVLLSHGANPHGELHDGGTPLMQAAWWGSNGCVAVLLKHDPDFLAMDHAGHDAVMNAAIRGHEDVLRKLLNAGAQADRANARGWTPLMFAARNGSVVCLQTLMEHNASLNVTPDGWTPLKEAARNCHPKIVAILLAAGANAHYRDKCGWSALDDAAHYGCPECLNVLLESGGYDQSAIRTAASRTQLHFTHPNVSKQHAARIEQCYTMLESHMTSDGKGN